MRHTHTDGRRVHLLLESLEGRLTPTVFTVQNLDDGGAGSLRQAVLDANAQPGDDTITFAAGLTGTISLLAALPDLSTNIDLEGPGPSVVTVRRNTGSGTPAFRIFDVAAGATVTLAGLEITGGSLPQPGGPRGAAGAGILNDGTLTVRGCTVSGNTAGTNVIMSGAAGSGAGVANFGTLTLRDSSVTDNTTYSGQFAEGGGVFNAGGATLTATGCTVADNAAVGAFGGLFPGGGLGGGLDNRGTARLLNCTITGNGAVQGDSLPAHGSGAVANFYPDGQLTVSYCTVVGNPAGGVSSSGGTATVRGTISTGNAWFDVTGALTSGGHNLVGADDSFPGFTAAGDRSGVTDPLLGPLADNGGPTLTMAPLPYSPAIDAGDPADFPAADQRGVARPLDGDGDGIARPDAGAVEAPAAITPVTPDGLFLAHLYVGLLGRGPDPVGLAGWGEKLAQGESHAQVALDIMHGPEYRERLVGSFYSEYLHRPPGSDEVAAYADALSRGVPADEIRAGFLASPEYAAQNRNSDPFFVSAVFLDVLGRPAEDAAQNLYTGMLAQGFSRADVALNVLRSPESDGAAVQGWYRRFLARPADDAGLALYTGQLQRGNPEEAVIASLVGSPEYDARL